jgi:hypothetical protein
LFDHRFYNVVAWARFTSCSCHFEWLSWKGMDDGPLAAPHASDKRSSSRSVAFSMDRARSVLLGKSEASNYRVTDFFRTMTAEQKAKYDAR